MVRRWIFYSASDASCSIGGGRSKRSRSRRKRWPPFSHAIDVEHPRDVVVLQHDLLAQDQPGAVAAAGIVLAVTEEGGGLRRAGEEHLGGPRRPHPHPTPLRRPPPA